MKILVLSDSHSSLRFMRKCADVLKPDAMVHLGDYYQDGMVLYQEHREIPLYQVPGNCDFHQLAPGQAWIRIEEIGGVKFYMTHGHQHSVKSTLVRLLRDAREAGVDAVLYGHTHQAECRQEEDGLWVINPGSAGFIASACVIDIEEGKIVSARILREADLR